MGGEERVDSSFAYVHFVISKMFELLDWIIGNHPMDGTKQNATAIG